MSQWTHVAGVIRFDDIRLGTTKFIPELGKTVRYNDPPDKWNECNVPCGSEGSLEYYIKTNPDEHCIAAYVASIWGDLRDYENLQEIVDYFDRITKDKMIRQACFTVCIEGKGMYCYIWTEEGKFVEVIPHSE